VEDAGHFVHLASWPEREEGDGKVFRTNTIVRVNMVNQE